MRETEKEFPKFTRSLLTIKYEFNRGRLLNLNPQKLITFRQIFKTDPELMPKYAFYEDEWNKVQYTDYQGVFPDQPVNTWFVLFR